MTISSTANRISYAGNSVTLAFAFNPSFQMQADLVVLLVDSLGNQTVQALSSQYTISGSTDAQGFYPNGGTINFVAAPATGVSVVIYRDPPLTQLVQHVDNGGVTAASLDNPIDKLTMAAQRDRDLINRSLRQPDGDVTGFSTVPPAATRANGGLGSVAGYDGTGQPTVFPSAANGVQVSVAMAPVVTAASLPLARVALGYPSAAGTLAGENIGQGIEDDGAGAARVKLDTTTDGASALLRGANGIKIDPSFFRGFLQGFEQSAPGANATMTWGPGVCVDSTNTHLIKDTTAAFTKTLASWVAGSGNGGLDTGTTGGAASTAYFLHVILNPTTGVVDRLVSLSATAPTLPTGFTLFRCIGWGKTDGSKNWLQITQRGDKFIYGVAVHDVNAAAGSATAALTTLGVPLGFQVDALFRATAVASGASIFLTVFSSPDETDQSPGASFNSIGNAGASASGSGHFEIRTNLLAQVRVRSNGTSGTNDVTSYGFIWTRGRNI